MEVAGMAGFYVAYRFRTQKGEKQVKGYISDKAAFPLALASPRNRKVSFVPLYLEEYLVEKPENKHIVQLIDLQKIRKSEVEKQIRGYTGDK